MTLTTWVAGVFLVLVSVQRLTETFARRGTMPGQRQMGWSFYAFFALHSIIIIGSYAELLAVRRTLEVGWCMFGLLLYLASVVLRNVAIRTLGKFWSLHVEIRQQHQLVRAGVYEYVRHPAYAAIVLEVLSIPLAVNAWWTMLFAAVTYVPLLVLRMRWEEKALVKKFGDVYCQYQSEVGALVPRWSSLRKTTLEHDTRT